MTAIFLSLSRVLPDWYPLTGDLTRGTSRLSNSIGHLLDVGIILPRAAQLYGWSAEALGLPDLNRLLVDGSPRYAWGDDEPDVWDPAPSRLARIARRLVPA
jgi:hypothetical protein